MRTTLNLDDHVYRVVKDRASHERRPVGDVVSQLLREALTSTPDDTTGRPRTRNGLPLFPRREGVVTNELVDEIRDREGI